MPFAFEVLHLASGKRVHNLAKREKTFCLVSSLWRALNGAGAPLMLKYTHYKFKIVHHKGDDKEERVRELRIIPTYFLKVQLDHSVTRECGTFPPTF